MLIHQPKRRRTVIGENDCKTSSGSAMKKHCALCTAFTVKPVGWSLQVTLTAFGTESTHFKLESLVKHGESAKHKKSRDKCVAKCSGSSGSIVKAFNCHDAHVRVCYNIVIVVLMMCDLTLSSILQKTNKTPIESACIHDVMKSSRLD